MFRPFSKVDIKISCEVFIVNGTNYCFLLRFAMGPVIDIVLYPTLDSFLTDYKLSTNPFQEKAHNG